MYVYVLDVDYTCQSHSFIRYWIESGLFSVELSWINTCIQRLDVGSSKGTLEKLGHEKAHRRLVCSGAALASSSIIFDFACCTKLC
jgi:hypothetical protein